jgi:hypothetical protein
MFSFVHKKTTSSVHNNNNSSNIKKQSMLFEFKQPIYRPLALSLPTPTPTPGPPPPPPPMLTDNKPKMRWGKPIWTFFHVTAQKVKPEYFHLVIREYLNFIILICSVLPCPVCSEHASQYMRSVNVNNIKTRDDLIHLFVTFHNSVNLRKGYPVLTIDKIPPYDQANTVLAMKQFFVAFEDKTRAVKLMADDLARMRIVEKLKHWINANIQYFDP